MNKTSRKRFALGAATAATAGVRFPAGAAEFTFTWANTYSMTHPVTNGSRAAADKITRDSGGRIVFRLFFAGQLGIDSSLLLQMRQGALDFTTTADATLAQLVPTAGIGGTPFAFPGYPQAWRAMDGPLGEYVRAAVRKAGFFVYPTSWDSGFRQLSCNTRPITEPDDMKGLKFRVPLAPVNVATFKAFGAEAVALGPNDLYTALQTHLIDGVELPLVAFDDFKFYEILKYMSIWSYQYATALMLANSDSVERLPKNLRGLVEKTVHDAAIAERNQIVRLDTQLVTKLKGNGMIFNQANVPAFKQILQTGGLYAKWRDQYGTEAWTLLERSVGKLA